MLSALIPTEHSYPTLLLVEKPVHQRFVQPGPLVLGSTSLKYQTPATGRNQPVSRIIPIYFINIGLSFITKGMDYTITIELFHNSLGNRRISCF